MKKYLKIMSMLLMVAAMSFAVTGCDDDEERSDSTGISIIGLWRHDFSSGYHLMCFNSDNTGYEQEYDKSDGKLRKKHEYRYTYDKDKRQLIIVESDGDVEEYTVMYVNNSEMEIVDPDGYSNKYVRVN